MEAILIKAAGLALMIFAGYALKRLGVFHTEDAKTISRVVIHLTLPAALITGFRSFRFEPDYLAVIAIALACNLALLALSLRLTRGRDAATRALYGLNVCSYNIGTFVLPFVQSFLSPEALIGVSMFDAGNCPINSGVAYALVARREEGERVSFRFVAEKLAHSVPFMTYLVLMLLSALGIRLPTAVYEITAAVGGANAFLAMLMIGILFEVRVDREDRREIVSILALRYGCNLALACLVWLLPLSLLIRQVSVLSLLAPVPSVAMIRSRSKNLG